MKYVLNKNRRALNTSQRKHMSEQQYNDPQLWMHRPKCTVITCVLCFEIKMFIEDSSTGKSVCEHDVSKKH